MRWGRMGGAWACRMVLHGQRLEKLGGCKRRPSVALHPSLLDLAATCLPDLPISVARTYYCNRGMGSVDVCGCCGLACTNAVSAECGTVHVWIFDKRTRSRDEALDLVWRASISVRPSPCVHPRASCVYSPAAWLSVACVSVCMSCNRRQGSSGTSVWRVVKTDLMLT
ncbi:hypothetical protein GGI43DRAFT_63344 [Trichoderma evansii]